MVDRINEYGKSLGVEIEHYIISSGLKEIIECTNIGKFFECIFASSYIYDANGIPIWPANVVNYTSKTQYIFRINKSIVIINYNITQRFYLLCYKNKIYWRSRGFTEGAIGWRFIACCVNVF